MLRFSQDLRAKTLLTAQEIKDKKKGGKKKKIILIKILFVAGEFK